MLAVFPQLTDHQPAANSGPCWRLGGIQCLLVLARKPEPEPEWRGRHGLALGPGLAVVPASAATSGTFAPTGTMNAARVNDTATLLPNGGVLVAGSGFGATTLTSAELYNPATGTWARTGSMTTARVFQTATLLPDGQVLVAGGGVSSAELYNPATGRWTRTRARGRPSRPVDRD